MTSLVWYRVWIQTKPTVRIYPKQIDLNIPRKFPEWISRKIQSKLPCEYRQIQANPEWISGKSRQIQSEFQANPDKSRQIQANPDKSRANFQSKSRQFQAIPDKSRTNFRQIQTNLGNSRQIQTEFSDKCRQIQTNLDKSRQIQSEFQANPVKCRQFQTIPGNSREFIYELIKIN